MKVQSFSPIADSSAKILILGSMPGTESLKQNQYYAHPRNAFWPIMAALFKVGVDQPYETRIAELKACHVAVWDVLQTCFRPGSLDSAIQFGSRIPNDFETFFKTHSRIHTVAFNGAEAEKSFKRYVLPQINGTGLSFVRLPSTSPAHAITLEKKIDAWRAGFKVLL